MVQGSRVKIYRVDREQTNNFKREIAFAIFVAISLILVCATFLNPAFMKGQVRTSGNCAVVTRQVNSHFDNLAAIVGDDQGSNSNLLTKKQSLPIADHVIDYSVGIHLLRFDDQNLAKEILHDINLNIDSDSSSEAQQIQKDLGKRQVQPLSAVSTAFSLDVVRLGANIAAVLLLVNIIIIILTLISMYSLASEMKNRLSVRTFVHDFGAGGMWAGFWLILIFGLFSFIPILFNVETLGLGEVAYLIEIACSIALDFVVVGVAVYVIAAVCWQLTAVN